MQKLNEVLEGYIKDTVEEVVKDTLKRHGESRIRAQVGPFSEEGIWMRNHFKTHFHIDADQVRGIVSDAIRRELKKPAQTEDKWTTSEETDLEREFQEFVTTRARIHRRSYRTIKRLIGQAFYGKED